MGRIRRRGHLIAVVLIIAACTSKPSWKSGSIEISEVSVYVNDRVGFVNVTVSNSGSLQDSLVGASSAHYRRAFLGQSRIDSDFMAEDELSGFLIPAGGSVKFEPMIAGSRDNPPSARNPARWFFVGLEWDVAPNVGKSVEVALRFWRAGTISIKVIVQPYPNVSVRSGQ